MKIIPMICLALTLSTSSIYGAEKPIKLSRKTVSPSEVSKSKSENLKEFASNNYATLISLENAPDSPNFKIRIERPLLREIPSEKNRKFHIEIDLKKELMSTMAEEFGTDFPCFVITSQGFLPGEEVILTVESDGFKSAPLKFYPHPIEMRSTVDNAKITVRLTGLIFSTTMYCFYLKDFLPNEKIKYSSESCGEVLANDLNVRADLVFSLTCGVVGNNGGLDTVKFYRDNGEILEVTIPWGLYLEDYLAGEKKAITPGPVMKNQKSAK